MADSETQRAVDSAQQLTSKPAIDSTQQVTSTVLATRQKNPKRVAAGKAIAERTKQARKAQKKKLAEADVTSSLQTISSKRLKRLLRLTHRQLSHLRLIHQLETF